MRYLVDPAQVSIGSAGWLFLLVICVALPMGALRQHRMLQAGSRLPSRSRVYASAIFTHASLLLLVWLVARQQQLDLFPQYRASASHVLIGLAALAIGLVPVLPRFRTRDASAEERIGLIAPRTRREHGLFYVLSASAGVAEELTYRGLLFTLIAALMGSRVPAAVAWLVPALVASAMFGVAHLFQGWKSSGVAAAIGFREQLIVGFTGTLLIAMAVHAMHNAIAGTVIAARARRENTGDGEVAVS